MATVIAFTNPRERVGKSTLAILYANHLTKDNDPEAKEVTLIDTSTHQDILSQRDIDMEKFGKEEMCYAVYDIKSQAIDELKDEDDSIILIDISNDMADEAKERLLAQVGTIVIPFCWKETLDNTIRFAKYIQQHTKKDTQIIFVPNKTVWRNLTEEDLKEKNRCNQILSSYGKVTAPIPLRADFTRINTYVNTPRQEEMSRYCFYDIDLFVIPELL